jgi:ssDNA-binding Zn-finger/Zn-ribbon topoisomerase 1
MGYEVAQTPYSNDKGKDIILWKDGKKYLVECKKYSAANTIGREPLQKFFAAIIEEGAELGYFVTTSDYKPTAVSYARDIKKIELINCTILTSMMSAVFPERMGASEISIMCGECGDIVLFQNNAAENALCHNGHFVKNDFDFAMLSGKYLTDAKRCKKCGRKMRIVTGYRGKFLGCRGYPNCRSTQKYE